MQTKNKKRNVFRRLSHLSNEGVKRGIAGQSSTVGHRKRPTGKNENSSGVTTPFTLKPITKTIPFLSVAVNQNYETDNWGNEQEQVRMIKDLYPIIASLPGFVEKTNWSLDNKPAEVLHDLLFQFEKLNTNTENWNVKLADDKYYINALYMYGDPDPIFIAADFMAKLQSQNKQLFEYLVYAFRLAFGYCGIDCFSDWCKTKHESGYHGMYYEYLLETASSFEEEEEEIYIKHKQCLAYYGPNGIPTAYSKLLHGVASNRIFSKTINNWKPKGFLECIAQPFLNATVDLIATKKRLGDYCNEPYENGEVTPGDYLKVIWNYDEEDLMWKTFSNHLDDSFNGCGASPFCWSVDLKKNAVVDTRADIDFCNKVITFFKEGQNMANEFRERLKHLPEVMPIPLTKYTK